MGKAHQWASEPQDDLSAPVEPVRSRRSVDWDRAYDLLVAGVVFTLYVIGARGLTHTFAPWVGYVLLTLPGPFVLAYELRQRAERRAAAENHARLTASREVSTPTVTIPTLP